MSDHPQPPEIWTTAALRLAIEAAGVALWSWNISTDELSLDLAARVLWRLPDLESEVTFEDLSAHIHPADRDRVKVAFYATRAVSGRYEIDFRILVERSISQQLGGSIHYDWSREGALVTLRMSKARLAF